MQTECIAQQMEFSEVERRRVVAQFDGGFVSTDAGALLLKRMDDEAIGLLDRLSGCFEDGRDLELIEFGVRTLVAQRVIGLALGYEDVNDHEQLRHDALLGAEVGKLESGRKDCAALAGKSTLNRLERSAAASANPRYHRIRPDNEAIESLFVEMFIESHEQVPEEILLDLDATDDPLHGSQEGRFFHGYYGGYCYLLLYIFCGRHLLVAKLRTADRDAAAGTLEEVQRLVGQIREGWPATRIVLRADSGFARDALMSWCEGNGVGYVFGLARNARLQRAIGAAQRRMGEQHEHTGRACREFVKLAWTTKKSWSATRRVVGKAERIAGKDNPSFVVTTLSARQWPARALYEDLYCARGEMGNRIKECQLDLFADRTSTATMRSNQFRLWLSSFAYALMESMRRLTLVGTELEKATAGTIRLKLLKIGAVVTVSIRRVQGLDEFGQPGPQHRHRRVQGLRARKRLRRGRSRRHEPAITPARPEEDNVLYARRRRSHKAPA